MTPEREKWEKMAEKICIEKFPLPNVVPSRTINRCRFCDIRWFDDYNYQNREIDSSGWFDDEKPRHRDDCHIPAITDAIEKAVLPYKQLAEQLKQGVQQIAPLGAVDQIVRQQEEIDRLKLELSESETAYTTLVGLLKKRFPPLPNGNLPDFAIEDVLKENERLKSELEKVNGFREELSARFRKKCDMYREVEARALGYQSARDTLKSELERAKIAMEKINTIRNSIIAFQSINWSEHIYPLVAALNEAGIGGMDYPEAMQNFGTMLERTNKAEAGCERLKSELELLRTTQARMEQAHRQRERNLMAELERAKNEIRGVLENIPNATHCLGEKTTDDDLYASLALSVARISHELERVKKERDEAQQKLEALRMVVVKWNGFCPSSQQAEETEACISGWNKRAADALSERDAARHEREHWRLDATKSHVECDNLKQRIASLEHGESEYQKALQAYEKQTLRLEEQLQSAQARIAELEKSRSDYLGSMNTLSKFATELEKSQAERIAALEKALDAARLELACAGNTFSDYAQLHYKKNNPEGNIKAAENQRKADQVNSAARAAAALLEKKTNET